ncbi:MAG: tRNA preQ1(34) S-adenosylmethionine ribosyltransferase-isomerase QueA [Gammaproteobacteria bacterium]|nr:tRNA preQ1(34) S-adenosylmethionine ribosyltransferase-isomerase QueA [Gammaproteobacteria bacterium]
MRRSDFFYDLPDELVAQAPLPVRSHSRLLCLDRDGGECRDRMIADLPGLLRPGDLLVFNDTRVMPARLAGVKDTGGRVEVLVERVLAHDTALVQIRASKPLRAGGRVILEDGTGAEVLRRARGGFYELRLDGGNGISELMHSRGALPLPPYITRPADEVDRERYQTVFARNEGAVAAPTAGLHFDADLFERLDAAGVARARITLHVGAGTFQPVRVEDLAQHRMHSERVEVDARTCAEIRAARARGGRVIAVGTTVVRALESASDADGPRPFHAETDIFITPGYRFRAIDGMITNFHMPHSTLLMLVCAFGGHGPVMSAYRHAVEARYRFFSYGDAMLIV